MSFRKRFPSPEERVFREKTFLQKLEEMREGKLVMLQDGYWKLDHPLGLEFLWLFLIISSGISFIFSFFVEDEIELISATIFIVAFSLFKNTDEFYIIDQIQNQFLYVLKFFSKYSREKMASLDDFISIFVLENKDKKKSKTSLYLYGLLKNGKGIVLSDSNSDPEEDCDKVNQLGEKLAELIGVPFFPYNGKKPFAFLIISEKVKEKNIEVRTGKNPHQIVIKRNGEKSISLDFSTPGLLKIFSEEGIKELDLSFPPMRFPWTIKILIVIIPLFFIGLVIVSFLWW